MQSYEYTAPDGSKVQLPLTHAELVTRFPHTPEDLNASVADYLEFLKGTEIAPSRPSRRDRDK